MSTQQELFVGKPRIRLSPNAKGLWCCHGAISGPGVNREAQKFGTGWHGPTPLDAYRMWQMAVALEVAEAKVRIERGFA